MTIKYRVFEDAQDGKAWLTTDHPDSRDGIPVLVMDTCYHKGVVGPSQWIYVGYNRDQSCPASVLVASWALSRASTVEERAAADTFLRQWPEGPQLTRVGGAPADPPPSGGASQTQRSKRGSNAEA